MIEGDYSIADAILKAPIAEVLHMIKFEMQFEDESRTIHKHLIEFRGQEIIDQLIS